MKNQSGKIVLFLLLLLGWVFCIANVWNMAWNHKWLLQADDHYEHFVYSYSVFWITEYVQNLIKRNLSALVYVCDCVCSQLVLAP